MNKPKSKEEKYITIAEIAVNLGLLEKDVESWLSEIKPEIRLNYRKVRSVSSRFLDCLSKDDRYEEAKRKSLESENITRKHEVESRKENLKTERKALLESYLNYIFNLEKLHKSCLDRVNAHHHESAITAAYLLFSKVISCLKLGVLSLENGFWYGGSVLREIDEALDLAHYFIVSENTDKGKSHLYQWFRHNRAPQHFVCREEISKHMAKLIGENEEDYQELMNELYQSKSKWTHPTYSSIREITKFDTSSGIKIDSIEYGCVSFETKLIELTHFFRSSIWSSFQCFQLCFSVGLPLTVAESNFITEYDRLFQQPEFHEW